MYTSDVSVRRRWGPVMSMIRKQLYIGERQQRKLRRVAARWGCTEAEVVRTALDQLADPDGTIEERLAASGLLVPAPNDPDMPAPTAEEIEAEELAWLESQQGPLGLAEAVLEDRR